MKIDKLSGLKYFAFALVLLVTTGCESEYEGLTAEEWFYEYDNQMIENEELTYELEDVQYSLEELQDCIDYAYSYEEYQDCSYY